jgi:hypothetical protein
MVHRNARGRSGTRVGGVAADYAADMSDIDVGPFVGRFYEEVLLPQRPA